MNPIEALTTRFDAAIRGAFGEDFAGTDPVLRRSTHADYQSNVALALKKRLSKSPRDIATAILERGTLADICEKVEIAGPGFLNLTLSAEFLARAVESVARDARLGVPTTEHPETVVIDYSAPNIAKEMHVGHLRSTIIGDAIARTLESLGHRVIRQNHLGDWGTPFGMLIEHLIDHGSDAASLGVGDLNDFYRAARQQFDASPAVLPDSHGKPCEFSERARARVVLLQAGDAPTLALWKTLVEASKRYFAAVYEKLGITLRDTDTAGESLYNEMLVPVVAELEQLGLATVDGGALCVFPPGFSGKGGAPLPLIVRKQDGGYGYATTDLAAVKYRVRTLGGTRLVYVVGAPQAQHLAMVFEAAKLAGWLAPPARAEHVAFGSVLGDDGKMLKTRAGEAVKLMSLLTEAEERALAKVREKRPDIEEVELHAIAHAVGIGAIKYADLSSDRVKDYVFDWDRMLAFEGNTGPYLMYAHARARSIFRKGGVEVQPGDTVSITMPEERALALQLLSFASAVDEVAATLEPHKLCTYLHDLATTFSAFFQHCPVLKAEDAERRSRLVLTDLTARVLHQGLGLLGVEAPDRM